MSAVVRSCPQFVRSLSAGCPQSFSKFNWKMSAAAFKTSSVFFLQWLGRHLKELAAINGVYRKKKLVIAVVTHSLFMKSALGLEEKPTNLAMIKQDFTVVGNLLVPCKQDDRCVAFIDPGFPKPSLEEFLAADGNVNCITK